jgi:hypothetical protein
MESMLGAARIGTHHSPAFVPSEAGELTRQGFRRPVTAYIVLRLLDPD